MIIFRQFFNDAYGALSYLLADPITRDAALIDPVDGQQEIYLGVIKQLGLTLRYLLETHTHDDHPSASPLLRESTQARLAMHEATPVSCCNQRLRDHDLIYLGEEWLEVLHTPGHTPCSITLRFQDRLFTGDTLGIGWVGYVQGKSNAEKLYDSIHDCLYRLPEETLVYPAHDQNGYRVSCISQEKLSNRDLPDVCTRAVFTRRCADSVSDGLAPLPTFKRNAG